MRRFAKGAVIALVGAVLGLAGCGGGGGSAPGLGPIPDGEGRITIKVKWPTAQAQSRMIMTTCQSIKVLVTGPGIAIPITATINRPQTTATLTVPVGQDRLVDAEGYDAPDAGGTQRQKAYQTVTVPEVAGGQTYPVTLYMADMWDPDDDTWTGAPTIPTDGTVSGWHTVDTVAGDQYDYFKFTAVAGQGYTFATQDVAGTGTGYYQLQVYDTDGTTWLASSGSLGPEPGSFVWTAPADGDYFVAVETSLWDIRIQYRGTVTAGGTGDIGIIID